MINGINQALQSAVQSVARPEEARELRQEPPAAEKAEYGSPSVKVSLQQTAQSAADQAVQDYRALGQKTTLPADRAAETNGQNDQQQAQQLRSQAYLATAALKTAP